MFRFLLRLLLLNFLLLEPGVEPIIHNNSQTVKYMSLNVIREPPERLQLTIMPPTKKKTRVRKYTLEIFIERAREIHGDKYDYSQIKPAHVQGVHSHVPIVCRKCGYNWNPTINDHINDKCNCPDCMNQAPWTLERFIIKANKIHGDKYDYSQIKPEDIQGAHSHIHIICKECGYNWNPSVSDHINKKYNCPDCSGRIPWTLERFRHRAQEIHGSKFDYSQIVIEHIQGVQSCVPIICRKCEYKWNPTINDHIHHQGSCPDCVGHAPWTLERFLLRANQIHSKSFDYSEVKPEHINRKESNIPLTCVTCLYKWNPTIDVFINHKAKCPDCQGVAPWTAERFFIRAQQIHKDLYDYSQIPPDQIYKAMNTIPIICKKCGYHWHSTIKNHINSKAGCRICCSTRGYSEAQIKWLEDLMASENIIIQHALSPGGEHKIPSIGKVDGYCHETRTVYEFHGDFWHGNPDIFSPEDIHPIIEEPYVDLYRKTIDRDQRIRNLGYNLIVKWETDLVD